MPVHIAAFFAGLAVFFGAHLYSTYRARGPDARPFGLPRGPYMGLYSLVSIAGFAAMVWGYAYLKPWIPVWDPPLWTRHVSLALMPFAVVLLVSAYVPTGYIKKAVRHPMLTAVKIWAVSHLLANGDLAGIILFGSFLVYAVLDRIALKRRGDVGAANAKATVLGDMIALAVGGAIYALIVVYLHPVLFGAEVIPYELMRR